MAGDQVIACAGEEIQVLGQFHCLAMENVGRLTSRISTARRPQYLKDTAGGCNPDFDPFRRLPLTWFPNYPGESGDGLNWVNSHLVNIPKETSPTHFHPPQNGCRHHPPEGNVPGARSAAYKLNTWGRTASLIPYPDFATCAATMNTASSPARSSIFRPALATADSTSSSTCWRSRDSSRTMNFTSTAISMTLREASLPTTRTC